MKKFKGLSLILLPLVMLAVLVAFPLSGAKAATKAELTLSAPGEVLLGKEIAVGSYMQMTDYTVTNFQFDIKYDHSKLEYLSVKPVYQADSGDSMMWMAEKISDGVIRIMWTTKDDSTDIKPGTKIHLFNANFKVKDTAAVGNTEVKYDISEGNVANFNDWENPELRTSDIKLSSATILLTKEKSKDTTLSALNSSTGTLAPVFSKDVREYNITVPYTTDKISFTAKATHEDATLSGTYTDVALEAGKTTSVKITVTAQDTTVTGDYIINVTRTAADADNTLASLTVGGTAVTITENPPYEIRVSYDVAKIDIAAAAASSVAVVSGDVGNDKPLSVGDNTFKIKVTAQNGYVREYIVMIKREACDVDTLAGLKPSTGSLDKAFNKDILEYKVSVPYAVNKITFTATKGHETQELVGDGECLLDNIGDNIFEIEVRAQNGNIKIYKITVNRGAPNTDNTLKSITLSHKVDSFKFDPKTEVYNITVPNSVTKLSVTPAVNNSLATLVSGTVKDAALSTQGVNKFEIRVKAEDGKEKVYTLNVTREKSSNNKLSSLTIKHGNTTLTLSPKFEVEKVNYTIKVPYAVDKITVAYTLQDKTAAGAVLGSGAMKVGENTVKVVVTAEDGKATRTYTIVLTRGEASTDSKLKDIQIAGGKVDFVPDTMEYDITVPFTVSKLTLTGVPNASVAKVAGNVKDAALKPGEKQTYTLKVTAEDGKTTSTYKVSVTREMPATDNTLASLTVDKGELDKEFAPDVTEYRMTVPYTVDKLVFTFEKGNQLATVNVTSPHTAKLVAGVDNAVKIIVTAQSGEAREYVILVHRTAAATDSSLKELTPSSSQLKTEFAPDVKEYIMSVGFKTEVMEFTYAVNNEFATAELVGDKALKVGENVFKITVTAQDGTKTEYVIKVTRNELSSDATLGMLEITGALIDFDPAILSYTVAVPEGTKLAEIKYKAAYEYATAVLEGDASLKTDADNLFKITVTAEDGTVAVYEIKVIFREIEEISTLADIKDSQGKLVFEPGKTEFGMEVPYNCESVTFQYITTGYFAKVEIKKPEELIPGQANAYTLTVTAEDGSQTVYTVKVTRAAMPEDAKLESIVPSYGTLEPEYSPEVTDYKLTVPFTVDSLTFEYVLRDQKSVVECVGDQNLVQGENKFVFTVTTPSGEYAVYTVTVTRNAISSDASLSEIKLNGKSVEGFAPDVFEYAITVPNSVKEAAWEFVCTYVAAKGEITTTPDAFAVGENIYVITVTAEDGTKAEYKLVVNRLDVDSDSSLSELKPSAGEIEFDPKKTDYYIHLENDVEKIEFEYKTSSKYANAVLDGPEKLTAGVEAKYTITVTADDGSISMYTVKVLRRALSTDSSASQITVNEIMLDVLATSKQHSITLPYAIVKPSISAQANDARATLEIQCPEDLKIGENAAKVIVTAEDGSQTVYEITIIRDAGSSDATLKDIVPSVGELDTAFDKSVLNYTMTVENEIESIEFDITPSHKLSSFEVSGSALNVGENVISIYVTSENGAKLTYVINVEREGNSIWYKLNHTVVFSIGTFAVTALIFGIAAIVIIGICAVIIILVINKDKVKRIRNKHSKE